MSAATTHRSPQLADRFVISCGTVTLDLDKSQALVIRWRKTGEYLLPKGRKDVGGRLEDTALRETFEETGIHAKLLPVQSGSLATLPAASVNENHTGTGIEPIAVAQRMSNGVLQMISWYVATADSEVAPEKKTRQEDEDFETVWAEFGHVSDLLSFADDRRIAHAAINAARRVGSSNEHPDA